MRLFPLAALLSALCVNTLAHADDRPLRDGDDTERTFYNDAEYKQALHRDDSMASVTSPTPGTTKTYDTTELEHDNVRNFYIAPTGGIEFSKVNSQVYRSATNSVVPNPPGTDVAYGPAFGAIAGWRLGYFNLGVRYQGAVFVGSNFNNLSMHKAYGEFGFNTRSGNMIFNGYLDGGYALAAANDYSVHGVGGKAGVGIDFLINRFFSIGPGISFDLHAYKPTGDWVALYGGTANVRVGFHI